MRAVFGVFYWLVVGGWRSSLFTDRSPGAAFSYPGSLSRQCWPCGGVSVELDLLGPGLWTVALLGRGRSLLGARPLVPLILPYSGLEGTQAQGGVAGAAPDYVTAQPFNEGPVVEVEDLAHREFLVAHLLHGDGGRPHADCVALAGEGEALDPAVAIPLKVDDDRAAALRGAAWHRDVRVFQNPLIAGVTGVLDEPRDPVVPFQKDPTALSARAPGCPTRSTSRRSSLPGGSQGDT